ncbi:phosphatase PAP2 family protein [Modestobacter sp. NPDC049651]|uniref:phosphatase PAP2 family protein n=1 Tax=unclassified Modestobacter TaxID=2643866 RepID=UPI0033F4A348
MQLPLPGRSRALVVVGLAALVVALLGLAVHAGTGPVPRLDRAVSEAAYAGDGRPGWLEAVLQVATAPGLSWVRGLVYLPVLVWLAVRRAWWTAAWVLLAVALVSPLTSALKELVGRPRPQFADGGARYGSLSFPSGHSSGVAALVCAGLVLAWPLLAPAARRAWTAAGIALALLVGATRLWLGVHFASDVVGGWCVGVGWVLLVAAALDGLPGGRAALRPRRVEVAA